MLLTVTLFLALAAHHTSAADLQDVDFTYTVNSDGNTTITGAMKNGKLKIPSAVST